MKRILIYSTAFSLFLFTPVFTSFKSVEAQKDMSAYQTISPEDAKELLDKNNDIILVDVRTEEEYEENHIPGAILLPNDQLESLTEEELSDKDSMILVYCRSGRRSKEAAQKLLALGYTNVLDLGGIIDWPYETVSGEEKTSVGILGSFSTTDLEGNTIDEKKLSDFDLTMINIWATYCGPCLQEMPELGELAAEYEDKNVQILGLVSDVLNSDGSLSDSQIQTASDIVEATKASYTHIVPSKDLWGLLYQITSVPTTFFVDCDGNLVGDVYIGSRSKADWATIIDETLGGIEQ